MGSVLLYVVNSVIIFRSDTHRERALAGTPDWRLTCSFEQPSVLRHVSVKITASWIG